MPFSAAYLRKIDASRQHIQHKMSSRTRWKRIQYRVGNSWWEYCIEVPVIDDKESEGARTITSLGVDSSPPVERTDGPASHVSRHHASLSNHNLLPTMSPKVANDHSKTFRAPKTYTLVSLWFLITVPIIVWDATYCFMRPRSMVGGDLHWIWSPYSIYQEIDYVYGVEAFTSKNGFTNAQSLMNVVETLLNIFYLYLAHVAKLPSAPLVGFTSASLTLAKTILYWAQEYYCGFCAVGHNSFQDLVIYWIIPNGIWIIVPTLIILTLGRDLVKSLNVAAKATAKSQ